MRTMCRGLRPWMRLSAILATAFTRATTSSRPRTQWLPPRGFLAKAGSLNHDGSHYALYDGYPKHAKRTV